MAREHGCGPASLLRARYRDRGDWRAALQRLYVWELDNINDDAIITIAQQCPLMECLDMEDCLKVTDVSLVRALGRTISLIRCTHWHWQNVPISGSNTAAMRCAVQLCVQLV